VTVSLKSIRDFIQNLSLLLITLVIALSLCEMAVRLFIPHDTGGAWRMPAPHGQAYWVNIPNSKVAHQFQEFSTTYSINSLGNRGGEPGTEAIQIIFLGDSFTFGLFIDEKDTSVANIGAFATEAYGDGIVGVVNAAIAGSGIAEWVAYLQDYGERMNPNLVVVNLNYVSISRGFKHPLFAQNCGDETIVRVNPPKDGLLAPVPSYRLYEDHSVSRFSKVGRWIWEHSQLIMAIRKAISKIMVSISTNVRSGAEIHQLGEWPNMPYESTAIDKPELRCFVKSSLKALRDSVTALGAKLVVVDIGYSWQSQVPPELSIDHIALSYIPEILKGLDIPYVNLTDQLYNLRQSGVSLAIPGDGHPTKEGYRAIAIGSWPTIKHQIDLLRRNRSVTRDN